MDGFDGSYPVQAWEISSRISIDIRVIEIVGPRDHWVNVLTHLAVDHGFSTFVLWGVPTAPRLRMFIEEIAPAVKERVAEVRART